MKRPQGSSYPMPIEEREEPARELEEFGYRETSDPAMLIGAASTRSSSGIPPSCTSRRCCTRATLSRARTVFTAEKARRPRGCYTLRQNIRVLDRWPPDRD